MSLYMFLCNTFEFCLFYSSLPYKLAKTIAYEKIDVFVRIVEYFSNSPLKEKTVSPPHFLSPWLCRSLSLQDLGQHLIKVNSVTTHTQITRKWCQYNFVAGLYKIKKIRSCFLGSSYLAQISVPLLLSVVCGPEASSPACLYDTQTLRVHPRPNESESAV